MKRNLLLTTALATLAGGLTAQTLVSTNVEKRNAVLEEFTGIYCTYCPDGHKRAQDFKDANPDGDVVLINIHAGGYAQPNGGDPDFRTSFGDAIANQSGLQGYPAGQVQRRNFPGQEQTDQSGQPVSGILAQGRGTWATTGATVLTEDSPINVGATASLDMATNELTVYVEAYYTSDAANATNKLNVALLENNVEGPQTGSNANPGSVLPNGNYNHNHMLRHLLTGQWGEDITTTSTGTLVTDTFVYTVPAQHNGIDIKPIDLEVAVFVAEGQEDILSGTVLPVTFTNIPHTNNATVKSLTANPEVVCGSSMEPKVTITNKGGDNLTALTFTYDVDGGTSESYVWFGDLAPFASEEVTLPSISYSSAGTHILNVATSNPNNNSDEDTSDDSGSFTFSEAAAANTQVTLNLLLDNYCAETSWEVRSDNGTVIANGGPYDCDAQNGGGAEANTTITETFNLSMGCFDFVIMDAYGDGLNASQWGGTDGSYELTSGGSTIISSTVADFGAEKREPFNVNAVSGITTVEAGQSIEVFPNPTSGIINVAINNSADTYNVNVRNVLGQEVHNEVINVNGSANTTINLSNNNKGMYFVTVKGTDSESTQIIVVE